MSTTSTPTSLKTTTLMPDIPPREPVADSFTGSAISITTTDTTTGKTTPRQAVTTLPVAETDAQVIVSGGLIARYGVRLLGKPHLSIVPGLLALDYGDMLTGEAAWAFLLKNSNLYPRAEVVGYRDDGSDDMIAVKWLDLALTPQVLIYADEAATRPAARPEVLIAPADAVVPARLSEYLPRYESLAAWRNQL